MMDARCSALDILFKLTVSCGVWSGGTIVDRVRAPVSGVGHAGLRTSSTTDEFVIVEQFSGVVNIDGALILHIDLFEHFINAIAKVLVGAGVGGLTSQIDMATITHKCNIDLAPRSARTRLGLP